MKPLSRHVLEADFAPDGIHLVEASAGTGKTYSIQTLYLRLVVARGIAVQQLLVVTFTEAATKELRERLRAILEKCRRCLESATARPLPEDDPDRERIARILALPLQRESDAEEAMADQALRAGRIRRALLDFDQAAIFTIHGFCQRALQEFAFECGHDFDAEVIAGDDLLRELCADWWRRVQHGGADALPDEAARRHFPGVGTLTGLMAALIKRPQVTLLPPHGPEEQALAERELRQALARAVETARVCGPEILEDIAGPTGRHFFPPTRRDRIARTLASLLPDSATDAGRLPLLAALDTALKPPAIANPLTLPPAVAECVEACAACVALAARHGIRAGGKGQGWSVPDEARSVWDEALARATRLASARRAELERFFAEVVARETIFFYSTKLKDSATLRQRLDALTAGGSAKDMLTALKELGAVRLKKNHSSWSAGAATGRLRNTAAALADAARRCGLIRLAAGMRDLAALFERRKREARGMTYDDMLERLWRALCAESDAAHPLRDALRRKYVAALIDEFQDTDPVQYRIFETLFADQSAPLFFVGDPKQAIYAFRGGDIHTYCAAKRMVAAERRYSLDTNYRSQAPLIAAVNAIFKDRDGVSLFGREEIRYELNLGCADLETRFVDNGLVDERPFKIWDYQPEAAAAKGGGRRAAGSSSDMARQVHAAVAEEVVRLLGNARTGFVPTSAAGDLRDLRRLRRSDIAILVRRHTEAAFIHRELRRRGVPAVRQAGDNVFDAPEAAELLYLLRAMVEPRGGGAVKTALASALLPVSEAELAALARDETVPPAAAALGICGLPARLDDWLVLFDETAALWRRGGFAPAFDALAERIGLRAWLAASPGGERSLVNVIQLQDLLHGAASDRRLGPEALLAWYERQLDGDARETNEAFETRLESDADAVRIMTIHKSKGLEFPVVFVPTMWSEIVGLRKAVCRVYHATRAQDPDGLPAARTGAARLPAVLLHLDMKDESAREAEREERQEEDMRNLYVAVTRASHRAYLVTGRLAAADSALARCLPRDAIARWAGDHDGPIEVTRLEGRRPPLTRLAPVAEPSHGELTARGPAHVDKSHGHASFTALAPAAGAGAGAAQEGYDFDAADAPVEPAPTAASGTIDAFSFPAGARTGECWHRIFELLDFGADAAAIRAVVAAQLALFRLDHGGDEERQARREAASAMVQAVLRAELQAGDRRFRLADIPPHAARHEMAFDFALRESGTPAAGRARRNAVWRALHEAWSGKGGDEALFLDRLRDWQRAIPGGYMTGFIDLCFEQAGRYYIVDWKSNRLDGRPESFDRAGGLAAEMARHAYFLQYLIYTVAFDAQLRQSLGAAYDYERDFGGVFYLFVRGMGTGSGDGQRGIYYAKPSAALVAALTRALMGRAPQGDEQA